LTHGRNRNEVFSADLSAISISVISVISVFREPSWGTYKMRNMVWVNKKAAKNTHKISQSKQNQIKKAESFLFLPDLQ